VQASVQVAPHIVDTALKYLSFCRAPQAAGVAADSSQGQEMSEQKMEEAFGKYLQGKSSHRLKEAKTLLNSSEPSVIGEFAKWRKGVHYLYVDSLAQVYLLSTQEWAVLHGKRVVFDKTPYSLQSVVAGPASHEDDQRDRDCQYWGGAPAPSRGHDFSCVQGVVHGSAAGSQVQKKHWKQNLQAFGGKWPARRSSSKD